MTTPQSISIVVVFFMFAVCMVRLAAYLAGEYKKRREVDQRELRRNKKCGACVMGQHDACSGWCFCECQHPEKVQAEEHPDP